MTRSEEEARTNGFLLQRSRCPEKGRQLGMLLHVVADHRACLNWGTVARVVPPSTSDNVLDDVVRSESLARVATGSLAVAVDGAQPEDMVEALVAFRRVEDRGSKTPDEGWEVDEEMKFRFRQKDTWRILSRKIE